MAVNFNDDTSRYFIAEIEKGIANQTSVLTKTDVGYKEMLQAQGAIAALRNLLNLPQVYNVLAATRG